MKYLASIALLICMTSATLCAQETDVPPQEAKIVLTAPDSARIGELVRLDVTGSTAESFSWLLVPGPSLDFEVYDGGKRAVFSARAPGEYRFIVAAAKGGTVDVVTHVVTVRGPPATPETDSLVSWIPFWLYSMDLPTAERTALADAFQSVIAAAPDSPKEWALATQTATRAALGDSMGSWKPFLQKIGAAMEKRAATGTLTTTEEHIAMWNEIVKGLRA